MGFLRRAYCVPYGGRGPPFKIFYVPLCILRSIVGATPCGCPTKAGTRACPYGFVF
jgi:hypothetical protein